MSQSNIKKQLDDIEEKLQSKLAQNWTYWDASLFTIINKQIQVQRDQLNNYAFSLDEFLNKARSIKKLDLTSSQFEKIKTFIFLNLKILSMENSAFESLLADYLIYLEARQGILHSFHVKHLPHNALTDEIEQRAQAFIKKFEHDYDHKDLVIKLSLEDLVVAYALYQLMLIKQSSLAVKEKQDLSRQIKQQLIEQGFTKPTRLYQYLHVTEEAITWGLLIALLVFALVFLMAFAHLSFTSFNLIGVVLIGITIVAMGSYAFADLKRDDVSLAYEKIEEIVEEILTINANSLVNAQIILTAEEQQPNDSQNSMSSSKKDEMHYLQKSKKLTRKEEADSASAIPSAKSNSCLAR
jgi:hypothetical protein